MPTNAPSLRSTSSLSTPGLWVRTKLPPPPVGPGGASWPPAEGCPRVSTGPGEGLEVGMRPFGQGFPGTQSMVWEWAHLVTLGLLLLEERCGWHLESMGSGVVPLLPCSKGSADKIRGLVAVKPWATKAT